MDILGQSALLIAVTSFALGLSTLARNVRNKVFIAYAILTLLLSLWAFAYFLEKIWGSGLFYRLHLLANIWLGPVGLAFVRLMIRIRDSFSRRLLDAAVAASMLATVGLLFHLEEHPLVMALILYLPGVLLVQIAHLMWIDRRLKRGLQRRAKLPTVGLGRRNLIYLGGILAVSTSGLDRGVWEAVGAFQPEALRAVSVFGNFLLAVYLFFVSQAISQQRLLNIGALFSRFLVVTAVALILTFIYSLLVAWVENSPGLFFLNSFIASFLIIMLLEPIRQTVGYLTRRLLTQKHQKLETLLRESQRKLTGVVDLGSLYQSVVSFLEQAFVPEGAAYFVLRSDGTKYRRMRATGTLEKEGVQELIVDHPLLQYAKQLRRRGEIPIILDQILESEIDRSASRAFKENLAGLLESLRATGANLLIPVMEREQILAFAVLRVHGPPEPWESNWGLLPIVYPYFDQVGQVMGTMEIYSRQRERERLAALGEMAAGLAHEIRNPLGAIRGAAQYLDPKADRPESRFLQIIIEEADRLNKVVTGFLDYSRQPQSDLKPLELSLLAQRTLEVFKPSLDPRIQLEFRPAGRDVPILGSAEQLRQVLLNLLQNAARALQSTERPRILVTVEVDRGSSVLCVEDNGPGIKREHLEKLFIPFFTTSPSGTGLGLSISQKIMEAHQGRIEVQSEEGVYARFRLIFPAQVKRGTIAESLPLRGNF